MINKETKCCVAKSILKHDELWFSYPIVFAIFQIEKYGKFN